MLGDLDAVRDWTIARDVMRGAWLTLQHAEPGDYVLAERRRAHGARPRGDRRLRRAWHSTARSSDHVRVDPAFVRAAEPTPLVGDRLAGTERARLGAGRVASSR